MRGGEKITAAHLGRTALIYIRQSSLAQVRENTESTARQYALADEAVRLGWARQAVEVIDADLGLSGRSADGRSGAPLRCSSQRRAATSRLGRRCAPLAQIAMTSSSNAAATRKHPAASTPSW